jgi:hypothetical protein
VTASDALRHRAEATLADVRGHLWTHGYTQTSLSLVAARLAELGGHPDAAALADEDQLNVGSFLAEDPTDGSIVVSTLMRGRNNPLDMPPHRHNSWLVAHVVRGRWLVRGYERPYDGQDPGVGELTVRAERVYEAGESAWYDPFDIHEDYAADGSDAFIVSWMQPDPRLVPLTFFDPRNGRRFDAYEDAMAMQAERLGWPPTA